MGDSSLAFGGYPSFFCSFARGKKRRREKKKKRQAILAQAPNTQSTVSLFFFAARLVLS